MVSPSPLQEFLSLLVGTGSGSGMAVLFLITGLLGSVSSFLCLCSKEFQSLNRFRKIRKRKVPMGANEEREQRQKYRGSI